MKSLKTKWGYLVFGSLLITNINCGGSTASSGSSETSEVASLSQLPDISSMVTGDSTSASVSRFLRTQFLVSGTAPDLTDITSDNADTYFYNGLIAQINSESVDTDDSAVQDAFNAGEGACRMAQNAGYSFQNIQQAGQSLCYMKNMPNAESGVTITGPDTPATLFAQTTEDKIVKIDITADPDAPEDQPGPNQDMHLFIKVYGTSTEQGGAGYAVDMFSCDPDSGVGNSLEKIRIVNETGIITDDSYNAENDGEFSAKFSGKLTTDTDGNFIFDDSQARTVDLFFAYSNGDNEGSFKGFVSVDGDVLTTKNWQSGSDTWGSYENKNKVVSQFSGSSLSDLKFLQAGFGMQFSDDVDPIYGATQFQDTYYASATPEGEYDLSDFDFTTDSENFWADDSLAADSDLKTETDNVDCSITPDDIVVMVFADSAVADVAENCESGGFQDMNFCDSSEISQARNTMWGGGDEGGNSFNSPCSVDADCSDLGDNALCMSPANVCSISCTVDADCTAQPGTGTICMNNACVGGM